jgi:Fe-Mn family superoxide dismutase
MNKREFLKLNAVIVGGAMLNPIPSFALFAPRNNNQDFILPDLDYAFNALEPSIDAMTMEIHHDKHHAGYVKKLNDAIKGTSYEGKTIEVILAEVKEDDTAVRNNAGGHYNHTLFWTVLTPNKGTKASPKLTAAINQSFGSMDGLKEKMIAAGSSVFGSGWAWLMLDKKKNLAIVGTPNQDNPMMKKITEERGMPIFGIDVWEHAYYLKYQNKRGDYLNNIWDIINWEEVSKRYEAALSSKKK